MAEEIIEQPSDSEVYERTLEPKDKKIEFNDEVKYWQQEISAARKIRKEKLKDLNELIDMYEGKQWHIDSDLPILEDKTVVNLIFANIKQELPYLYFQNPSPIVKATKIGNDLNAFAARELVKHYAKYNMGNDLKQHVRLAILDAKFSFGCIKVTYTPVLGNNPNVGKPIINGYDEYNDPIFEYDENGSIQTEDGEIIISEFYMAERVSPREVLVDPRCRNFVNRAKWVGQEIVKPVSYFKNNELYKNTDDLMPNVEISKIFSDTLNRSNEEVNASLELCGDQNKLVRAVEIYDIENKRIIVLPDNYPQFIRNIESDVQPFSFLKFNESPDNFYPIPDVRIEKPIQEEVNVGRSMMITHARRAARKYYYTNETFWDDDDLEDFKSPQDMSIFKIKDYDKPPMPLATAQMDASIYQNLAQSRIDFNVVSNNTEAMRGISERRKTGKESGYQEAHGAVRRTDKQSLVADFISNIYKTLLNLMQKTLSVPQAVQIIGKTGMFWSEISKDDIQGEFFLEVDVNELRPATPEVEREELGEMIVTITNFVNAILQSPVGPMIFNIQGIVQEFVKTFPRINVENILNMQVSPEQIATMMLQQNQNSNNSGV